MMYASYNILYIHLCMELHGDTHVEGYNLYHANLLYIIYKKNSYNNILQKNFYNSM